MGRWCFAFVVQQADNMRFQHCPQHLCGDRVGFAVVVNVGIEAIHHIELRIGEEFFEGGVFDGGVNVGSDEAGEVRLRGECGGFFEGGGWKGCVVCCDFTPIPTFPRQGGRRKTFPPP
jgi:hypothetical protein